MFASMPATRIALKNMKVTIDNTSYQFFGEDDSAWSMKDDKIIIDAMKAGKKYDSSWILKEGN